MTEDTLVAMVRRYRQLGNAEAEIRAEMNSIKSLIENSVEEGWSMEIDGVPAAKRKGNRKFSKDAALELLTESEKLDCLVTVYHDGKVREMVEAKDLLDAAMIDVGAAAQVRLNG